MGQPLRVLIVEDSEDDALLMVRELKRGGYEVAYQRVFSAQSLQPALDSQAWDVVIADYSLPQLNGLAALELVRRASRDLPFLLVSGTIGEETAVAAMKSGAQDYIMKSNLTRLLPAVERELDARQRRRRAETDLRVEQERLLAQLTYANALNRMAEAIMASDDSPTLLGGLARILGETLGLDRCLICNVGTTPLEVACLTEWTDPAALPAAAAAPFDLGLLSGAAGALWRSRTWLESHVDAIHPALKENGADQKLHAELQVCSLLSYPFFFRSAGFCMLVFLHWRQRRAGTADEQKFLDAVTKQVGLALQKIHILKEHQRAQEALTATEARLRKVMDFWDFGGSRPV